MLSVTRRVVDSPKCDKCVWRPRGPAGRASALPQTSSRNRGSGPTSDEKGGIPCSHVKIANVICLCLVSRGCVARLSTVSDRCQRCARSRNDFDPVANTARRRSSLLIARTTLERVAAGCTEFIARWSTVTAATLHCTWICSRLVAQLVAIPLCSSWLDSD